MKLILFISILAGKVVSFVSRACGYRGSSLPGLVARRIYLGCLRDLADQVREGIIVVTGTNGKTTTTNMIAGILSSARYKIIGNYEGANMISGATTSFIMSAGISGKIDCDYAVIEVDEASVPAVMKELKPSIVVITNFFRDQLDRYWEIDKIISVIRDSLNNHRHTTLVLNADDPLVAQLGETTGLPAVYYGIGRHRRSFSENTRTREAKFCPFCGSALSYEFFHYGQLGNYSCTGCKFKRPTPRVEAMNTEVLDKITCSISYDGAEVPLAIQVYGIYNLYNALAAFLVGLHLGIDVQYILSGLSNYRPVTGRMERFNHKGKQVFLSLVKNPTGFNEGLSALCADQAKKDVFIAINDNDADGRDVSWLWDVDFEMLDSNHGSFHRFICTGRRGEEMALRLKYAGVPQEKISVTHDMRLAVRSVLDSYAENSYFFSTYTALWDVHEILEKMVAGEDEDAHD